MTMLQRWVTPRYTRFFRGLRPPQWRTLSLIFFCLLALPLVMIGYVRATTQTQRFTQVQMVPRERVALVFGAGVRPDGRLTRMLAERVTAAVELYKAGRVEKLLMTGDNSRADYDEVTAMKGYAVTLGVPAQDITLDFAGFSTYESCYRARAIFGVQRAILVTQQFHLPRAVYTCDKLGVEAVGFGVRDWGAYRESLVITYTIRDSLATLKALWQVHITQPLPTFLGAPEVIR